MPQCHIHQKMTSLEQLNPCLQKMDNDTLGIIPKMKKYIQKIEDHDNIVADYCTIPSYTCETSCFGIWEHSESDVHILGLKTCSISLWSDDTMNVCQLHGGLAKMVFFGQPVQFLGLKRAFEVIFGSKCVILGRFRSFSVILGHFQPFSAISVTFFQNPPVNQYDVQNTCTVNLSETDTKKVYHSRTQNKTSHDSCCCTTDFCTDTIKINHANLTGIETISDFRPDNSNWMKLVLIGTVVSIIIFAAILGYIWWKYSAFKNFGPTT